MNLIIANTAIRTDAENRYCLNDLHKAAGSLKHHQPAKFAENSTTQDLIQAIREQSPNSEIDPYRSVRGGTNPGTYVCKELVYAYAMWISPKFHLLLHPLSGTRPGVA